MTNKSDITRQPGQLADGAEKTNLPGYPLYPDSDDIYAKDKEEADINPEEISQTKEPNEAEEKENGDPKNFYDDESGSDLDVPGSELDEKQENFGSEDEENNFYSLGGDDHNDLEEDRVEDV